MYSLLLLDMKLLSLVMVCFISLKYAGIACEMRTLHSTLEVHQVILYFSSNPATNCAHAVSVSNFVSRSSVMWWALNLGSTMTLYCATSTSTDTQRPLGCPTNMRVLSITDSHSVLIVVYSASSVVVDGSSWRNSSMSVHTGDGPDG